MSFMDIKIPKKHDAIVADYLVTVKRIQQRNLSKNAQDLARQDDLRNAFSPVVESTEKLTETLTKKLAAMREERKFFNELLAATDRRTSST